MSIAKGFHFERTLESEELDLSRCTRMFAYINPFWYNMMISYLNRKSLNLGAAPTSLSCCLCVFVLFYCFVFFRYLKLSVWNILAMNSNNLCRTSVRGAVALMHMLERRLVNIRVKVSAGSVPTSAGHRPEFHITSYPGHLL